jgi:arylformamidase
LDDPNFTYYKSDAFSGSLNDGGSVNCEMLSFYPHGSGTHTECALHVLKTDFDMRDVILPNIEMGKLITVELNVEGDDTSIDLSALKNLKNENNYTCLIVRFLPNEGSKNTQNYSGTNPPYFSQEALEYIKNIGFRHLLTDCPSIDKENDDGLLLGHKIWFTIDGKPQMDRTITELIYVPEEIQDGDYAVSIHGPSIETDAVPTKVLLYPCV